MKPYPLRETVKDHIFFGHIVGLIVGIVAGATYASFHWHDLQEEFGRSMTLGVVVAIVISGYWANRTINRVKGKRL